MIEKTIKIELSELIQAMSDDDYIEIFNADHPSLTIQAYQHPVSLYLGSQSGELMNVGLITEIKNIINEGNGMECGQAEEQRERLTNLQFALKEGLAIVTQALS